MVQLARKLNRGISFHVDDFRSLHLADGSLAGIVAFYSLIHVPADQLASALAELRRVLRPGGRLLAAVHEGREVRRPTEMWGIPITLEFNFLTRDQLAASLHTAGFSINNSPSAPPTAASKSRPTASTHPPSEGNAAQLLPADHDTLEAPGFATTWLAHAAGQIVARAFRPPSRAPSANPITSPDRPP
jgi:SAM-dependent methyltransferase